MVVVKVSGNIKIRGRNITRKKGKNNDRVGKIKIKKFNRKIVKSPGTA